jgi:hypothetical protein
VLVSVNDHGNELSDSKNCKEVLDWVPVSFSPPLAYLYLRVTKKESYFWSCSAPQLYWPIITALATLMGPMGGDMQKATRRFTERLTQSQWWGSNWPFRRLNSEPAVLACKLLKCCIRPTSGRERIMDCSRDGLGSKLSGYDGKLGRQHTLAYNTHVKSMIIQLYSDTARYLC